jgi:hypothetical protein
MVDIAQVHATLVAGKTWLVACVERVRTAVCNIGRRSVTQLR